MGSDLASEESLRNKKNLAARSTGNEAMPLHGIKSMSIDGEPLRLHERYKRGDVSPVEVARAQLDAIGRLNPGVNAFVLVDDSVALEMARASVARYRKGEALGPLDGIPITIKDTLNVAGWPTRRGSRTTSNAAAPSDAVAIARLRAGGAVFMGKTTTPEFAWKGLTESPLNGVTLNPRDQTRHAGGSSGGAAAATALGLGVVGIGTDAAGSVRIPAAFCGVVGYKPTFGAIPLDPYPAAFWQLPHIGPITRRVADAALAASVMSGAAGADWTSLTRASLDFRLSERKWPSKIRIGVPAGLSSHLDPLVKTAWEDALSVIAEETPITTVEVPVEESRDIVGALYRLGCSYAVSQVPNEKRADLHAALLEFIAPVQGLTAEDLLRLQRRREEIATRLSAILIDAVDVLLTPTMPCLPLRTDAPAAAAADWFGWCPFTPLFNLSHGPAVSVPWHSDAGVFPIGLQVGAAPGRDGVAIAAATMIEALADRRRPARSRASVHVG
jgi:aspartyl-tRNA(Asn)/glutamyl-tRNA(Gln) amidotransferase subunit A